MTLEVQFHFSIAEIENANIDTEGKGMSPF